MELSVPLGDPTLSTMVIRLTRSGSAASQLPIISCDAPAA